MKKKWHVWSGRLVAFTAVAVALLAWGFQDAAQARQDERGGTVVVDGVAITPEMMEEALNQLRGVESYDRPYLPEGMKAVSMGNKYGFISNEGRIVIAPRFDLAHDFAQGRAAVHVGGKWGYIDPKGKTAIPLQFEEAREFRDNFAVIKIDGRFGFINLHGRLMIQPLYEDAGPFSEELAAVRVDGKWGYVTRLGVMAIAPRFAAAGIFSEGLAAVGLPPGNVRQVGWKWGYIDQSGRLVIGAKFTEVHPFHNGRAQVWQGKWHGDIDKTGKWIGKPTNAPILFI